jgi:glutathione S-transferase
MLQLHQFARGLGLPNASPFCMKVEAYLRVVGIPYESVLVTNPSTGPYGKAPWITDGDTAVPDSRLILDYLRHKHGDRLGEGLTAAERARHRAIQRLCEESLYFILMAERWTRPENYVATREALFANVPSVMRGAVFAMARRSVTQALNGQGVGRLAPPEVDRLGAEDIDALAGLLGDEPYFGGGERREIDVVTIAFLANILAAKPQLRSPLREHAERYPNLVAYSDRVMREIFPDFCS